MLETLKIMKKYLTSVKIVILAGILSVGVGFVLAQWTPPGQPFPDGNPPAPVNVGLSEQVKEGSFWANFIGSQGPAYVAGNFEVGSRLTIAGGDPGAAKILVAENNEGLVAWSRVSSFSCERRTSTSANASTASVSCVPGEILTGGGGDCGNRTMNYSRPHATQGRWEVQCAQLATSVSATAICCEPNLRFLDVGGPMQPI